MKPIDIAKVLAMPEEEFIEWLNINLPDYGYNDIGCCLASLSVRLWSRAMSSPELREAMIAVQDEVEGSSERKMDFIFWAMRARLKHKILAALEAMEK